MKEENQLQKKFRRGAVKGKSCIAYSFDLPSLGTEAEQLLTELCEKYLAFLQEESEKECSFVRFAGLSLEQAEKGFILHAALCPFELREYRPVARLILNENGKLLDIKKEKRSRQKP